MKDADQDLGDKKKLKTELEKQKYGSINNFVVFLKFLKICQNICVKFAANFSFLLFYYL